MTDKNKEGIIKKAETAITDEVSKINRKLHHNDKHTRSKKVVINDIISEEIDLNTEAAVNITEHENREHTHHDSIEDMTR
ncbi:MAG: hypothetical protein RR614_07655 [Eubacterium sp.]